MTSCTNNARQIIRTPLRCILPKTYLPTAMQLYLQCFIRADDVLPSLEGLLSRLSCSSLTEINIQRAPWWPNCRRQRLYQVLRLLWPNFLRVSLFPSLISLERSLLRALPKEFDSSGFISPGFIIVICCPGVVTISHSPCCWLLDHGSMFGIVRL